MTKKDPEKKKIIGHRKFILASIILFIPSLLALIGFNLLLLFSATNSFLALLVEVLGQYVLLINCFLIFSVCFVGLFLALGISNYRSFKRKINAHQQIVRSQIIAELKSEKELEKTMLQFLTDNGGKAFTYDSLINRISQEGVSEMLKEVLNSLVESNKINRTKKDNAQYYSIQ